MSSIPVLLYHSVDRRCSPAYARWMVSPERFSEQMKALIDAGYRSGTISELAAAMRGLTTLPQKSVFITFDDGLADFMDGALPILDEYGLSSTLYVVAGQIGQTSFWLNGLGEGNRAMLSWAELGELAQCKVEIGAHTLTHPQLDVLPLDRMREEISLCKSILENGLGQAVNTFAYPHGYSNRTTRDLVQKAGYSSACRVRHALSSQTESPFCISRIIVTEAMDGDALIQAITGHDLPTAPPPDRLLSDGWRVVRRLHRIGLQ